MKKNTNILFLLLTLLTVQKSWTQDCDGILIVPKIQTTIDQSLIEDSIIDVCLNEEINFKGDWEYINNENQAKLVGSVFNWTHTIYEPGEDTVILKKSGRLFSHTFNKRGIHQIDLDVKNAEGCSNKIYEKVFIRVSHIKTDEIDINPPVSCIDIETDIEVTYDPSTSLFPLKTKYTFFTPTIIKDSKICEEDIVSYKTSKKVNSFLPNQTLVNINNFDKVCLKMEHQSVNHITIELQAPNGKTVVLLGDDDVDDESGNGLKSAIRIGTPNLVDDLNKCGQAFNEPGDGSIYCWSPNPTTEKTWHELGDEIFEKINRIPRVVPSQPDNNKIYKAYDNSFTQIEGSPLNGEWTLKIEDINDTDPGNGYVSEWWIDFEESIIPSNKAYKPYISSYEWMSSDTLYSNLKKNTFYPTVPRKYDFKLNLTDSLGCNYSFQENVLVPTKVLLDRYESVPDSCENRIGSVLVEGSGGTKPYTYFWNTLDKTDSTILYLRAGDYPYTITDATNCKHEGIITVEQRSKDVTAAFSFELDTCNSRLNLNNESTNS